MQCMQRIQFAPMTELTISFRIPAPLMVRIDRIGGQMSASVRGIELRKSEVLRAILERGAESYEAELGLKPKPKHKKK